MGNFHLFFDVFIEDAPLGVYLRGDRKRFEADHEIRKQRTQYKYQKKLDITRYTLHSYASVNWQSVTIRIYCENQNDVWIYDEVKSLFPNANIERRRSSTGEEFKDALKALGIPENDWVFFSTNNDHPLLVDPVELEKIVLELNSLEDSVFAGKRLAIPYSHFTEINNMGRPTYPLWGHYGGIFPKCIFENSLFSVLKLNKLCLDSILLLKYSHLKEIFESNTNRGRLIRTEDTSLYLEKTDNFYWVCPKTELCRHYDGYTKFLDKVPPLFIPDGFFEKNISLVIGEGKTRPTDVLIDPNAAHYSYQVADGGADLLCSPDDIPFFWSSHISKTTRSNSMDKLDKSGLLYYQMLANPWGADSKLINLMFSCMRLCKELVRSTLKKFGIMKI